MRKLAVEKGVLKELEGLPLKQYRQVVSAIFDLLADPAPHYSKSLEGSAYRRIAVGEYRVIYRFGMKARMPAATLDRISKVSATIFTSGISSGCKMRVTFSRMAARSVSALLAST